MGRFEYYFKINFVHGITLINKNDNKNNHYLIWPQLGTLEWITFNPDCLIRISTVETFNFSPNPLFFSLLGYPLIVFSNENISVLSLVARFSLIGCYSFPDE